MYKMTVPQFADTVEHKRLDVTAWDDVYVIGDVHGCHDELNQLLSTLDVTDTDLVVFVGDLVRKGPDSKGVLEHVRRADNMFTIRGNNEEKLLRGEKSLPVLSSDDLSWIESRPAVISWQDTLVVHGGVDPRKQLSEHTTYELQTFRSLSSGYERPFWWERYNGSDRVFFGHTPLAAPVYRECAIGLDTGCVYGNQLTAYDWRRDRFHTVTAEKTVQHRKESKWVQPERSPPAAD